VASGVWLVRPLDLGGTVVELISYKGASIDPAPEKEHLGYRMMALEVDASGRDASIVIKLPMARVRAASNLKRNMNWRVIAMSRSPIPTDRPLEQVLVDVPPRSKVSEHR
jgi:hypothetical protein